MAFTPGNGKHMNNEKLAEIGDKLEVSEEDIGEIKDQYRGAKILAPIFGLIISAILTWLGYCAGRDEKYYSTEPVSEGYQYAAPAMLIAGAVLANSRDSIIKKRNIVLAVVIVLTLILSIIGYVVAYDIAYDRTPYGSAILYSVYSKDR